MLAAADLSVELGGLPVLRGITLSVHAGEAVALLGGNGSGKSTLVRALLGLVPVQRGTVELFGTPRRTFRSWSRIGYVPQRSTAGLSGAKVKEVVAAGRLSRRPPFAPPRPDDRAAVARALDTVGLTERAGDRLSELSGGQQQRVLIARALAGEPELLVLDEPTAGVDLAHQTALADTLTELVSGGTALVVVLHEVGPLAGLLDRGGGAAGGPGRLRRSARATSGTARVRTPSTIPRCSSRAGWTGRSSDDRAPQLPLHAAGPAGRAAHRADRPGHRHLHRPAAAQPARRRSRPRRHRRRRPGPAHRPGADPGRRRCLRGRRGRRSRCCGSGARPPATSGWPSCSTAAWRPGC